MAKFSQIHENYNQTGEVHPVTESETHAMRPAKREFQGGGDELEDKYDRLCAILNQHQDTPDRTSISSSEYLRYMSSHTSVLTAMSKILVTSKILQAWKRRIQLLKTGINCTLPRLP